MKLPKWATTVTPLSKIIALIIFITFPIVGTYMGYRYGIITSKRDEEITSNFINWQSYISDKYKFSIDYPSDVTVINELNQSSGTKNMQKTWHLMLTNQKDYPKVENSLYGKGYYYIQIEISDSTNYEFPFKGRILVTEDNFNSLFESKNSEKGYLGNSPTLKSKNTIYPKHGHIDYIIYNNGQIIEVNIDSDNLDIIPFTILDKIISSIHLL
jgi:hypothetical protein